MTGNSFIRFALVGLLNTTVGYGVILLLHYKLDFTPAFANLGGYLIGSLISYLLNRSFTFSSNRPHSEAIPRFIFIAAICFAINLAVLQLGLSILSFNFELAQALALITYTASFYLASRFIVFRKNH